MTMKCEASFRLRMADARVLTLQMQTAITGLTVNKRDYDRYHFDRVRIETADALVLPDLFAQLRAGAFEPAEQCLLELYPKNRDGTGRRVLLRRGHSRTHGKLVQATLTEHPDRGHAAFTVVRGYYDGAVWRTVDAPLVQEDWAMQPAVADAQLREMFKNIYYQRFNYLRLSEAQLSQTADALVTDLSGRVFNNNDAYCLVTARLRSLPGETPELRPTPNPAVGLAIAARRRAALGVGPVPSKV